MSSVPFSQLPDRHTFAGYLACALAGSLWGTGFFFGRIALDEMSVEHMVLYRFLFASLGMLPLAIWKHVRLSRLALVQLLICTFLGIPVQFLIQFHGLARTTVSHAALMVGAMPVILAFGAALFTSERLDRLGWIAIAASTLGAALVVIGGREGSGQHGEPSLYGDLLILGSLVTALGWILLNKTLVRRYPPTAIASYSILIGTLMLLGWVVGPALLFGHPEALPPIHGISLKAWLALAASGFFCTAATTTLWNWGLQQVPASRAGVFLNLEPVIGSILGVTLLGEQLGPWAGFGGLLILSAAVGMSLRGSGEGELLIE